MHWVLKSLRHSDILLLFPISPSAIISCPEGFENFKFSIKNVGQISTNIFFMKIVLIWAPVSGRPSKISLYTVAHMLWQFFWCLCLTMLMFANSARQKIEEDLLLLDRQIRLQLGETIKDEGESPAEAYLATPMVWTEIPPLNKMLCEC